MHAAVVMKQQLLTLVSQANGAELSHYFSHSVQYDSFLNSLLIYPVADNVVPGPSQNRSQNLTEPNVSVYRIQDIDATEI